MKIPFNKVYQTGAEDAYVLEAIHSGLQCGNHKFCNKVIDLMKSTYGFQQVYLTPSGTAALDSCRTGITARSAVSWRQYGSARISSSGTRVI